MPRPSKKPGKQDLQEIEALAGIGLTQQQIADIKGLCVDTLRKYARLHLIRGKSKGIAKLAETAYKRALAGNTAILIFLLKTQAGWREHPPLPEDLMALFHPRRTHDVFEPEKS